MKSLKNYMLAGTCVLAMVSNTALADTTYTFNDGSGSQTQTIDGYSVTIACSVGCSFPVSYVTVTSRDTTTPKYKVDINSPQYHTYTFTVDGYSYSVDYSYLTSDDTLTYYISASDFANYGQAVSSETQAASENVIASTTQAVSSAVASRVSSFARALRSPTKAAALFNGETIKGHNSTITGMASGGKMQSYGIWFTPSYTDYETDYSGSSRLEGESHNASFGVDALFDNNVISGISLTVGREKTEEKEGNFTKQTIHSYTVTAYGGYLIDETFSVEGYISMGVTDGEMTRDGAGNDKGDYTGNNFLTGVAITGYQRIDDFDFEGKLSFNHGSGRADNYTLDNGIEVAESKSRSNNISFVGELSYAVSDEATPYIGLGIDHDLSYSGAKRDETGGLINGGVRLAATDIPLTGSVDLSHEFGRGDAKSTSVSATVRYDF